MIQNDIQEHGLIGTAAMGHGAPPRLRSNDRAKKSDVRAEDPAKLMLRAPLRSPPADRRGQY